MPSIEAIALAGLLGLGLAILGAGLFIAITGIDRMRTARRLRDAGPIPLTDVPDASGLVEFEGTARPSDADLLEAPLSGEPCLAYTVQSRSREGTADDPDAGGPNAAPGATGEWHVDGGAAASVPFLVADGPDRVRVDPADAVLSLDWGTAETEWRDGTALSAAARDRVATADVPGFDRDGDGSQRVTGSDSDRSSRRDVTAADGSLRRPDVVDRQYRERRLEPGTDVRVFGGSVRETADSSGRDGAPDAPVTVTGDDWFEIAVGDAIGGATVLNDRRRSGSLYVVFGGLLAVPGLGFTLAGLVGLISTLAL